MIAKVLFSRFLWIKFFFAGSKPREKRNTTGFILYASDSPLLNSPAKIKQVFNFFSTLGLIGSIKTLNEIYENIL